MKYALTVIVLQYGKSEETLRCLEALSRSAGVDARCVVVDNASRQEDRDRLRDCGFAFEFLQNEENLGFAGGNNVVLRRLLEGWRENGHARYGLLLNNDVQVETGYAARDDAHHGGQEGRRRGRDQRGPRNRSHGLERRFREVAFGQVPRDVDLAALPARSDAVEVETLCGSTLLLDLRVLWTAWGFVRSGLFLCVRGNRPLLADPGGRVRLLALHARPGQPRPWAPAPGESSTFISGSGTVFVLCGDDEAWAGSCASYRGTCWKWRGVRWDTP